MDVVLGFAYGCFDVIDREQLNYLRHARTGCHYLVVGLMSDELIDQLKGARPVIPLLQRTQIVGAIRGVDDIVPLTSINLMDVWQALRFDVIFSPAAEEWLPKGLWADELVEVGVKVVSTNSERPNCWSAE